MDQGGFLPIFIIILLFIAAAYFALAETAIVSVSRVRLRLRADRGERNAVRALWIVDNIERAITTILIGTNIARIVAAAMITVMATRAALSVALTTVVTALLLFFLCDMLPKSIAKKYSERLSLAVAPSLYFFMRIFAPLSILFAKIGSQAAKLSKGDPELTVTEDELFDIVETMTDEGEIDQKRGELLYSALEFDDVTVESILTARVDLKAIDLSDSCEEVLETIKREKHSRLPVYRDSVDNIVGVLLIRKYIKAWLKQGPDLQLETLLEEPYFVHGSAKIDELLPELSRRKTNLAVVTDNYGGTLGIVTVEDILEELVGEIWDEDDDVLETFTALPDGSFELDPSLPVEDAFEEMDFEDPENRDFSNKLMGEWAYEQFEKIPQTGDSFRCGNLSVEVSAMRQNRILKLRARLLPKEADALCGGGVKPPAADGGEAK
ncbi:MAG: hemolysin family protein [Firmicutes bacterium]|nr:hemolysin family protein [Bacillota bacterium]